MGTTADLLVRRELRERDAEAIVELHRRVYVLEYGMNETFVQRVSEGVREAHERGWPERSGAVWLVDRDEQLSGCVALTDEGDGVGRLRWVVLAPELRGCGLGRRLIGEMVDEARANGLNALRLETFSALRTAARIYRDAGFHVTAERERLDWGPPIVYQHYELTFR